VKLPRRRYGVEDSEIIALYFERSENAIRETRVKYARYCNRIAMNILRNEQDAEECVSDALLRVWNSIPPSRPERFTAYIGKLTRNLSLNRLEARNAEKRGGGTVLLQLDELTECLPSGFSVDDELSGGLLTASLNDFLGKLPRDQRMVFVRRYWYMDGVADIASLLDMSESRVKSILFRTRKKLKSHLENDGFAV
jgi:RNA polymerase sigma-70 factor (ECF subfamily)